MTDETEVPVYPPARRADQVDVLHGVSVADPFRWLEDADAPETRTWIEAQNALTAGFLHTPERDRLRDRLTRLWNYERYGIPFQEGGRYFWSKNDGLQNQSVLFVADTPDEPGRVLLDPNTLSADGTIALSGQSVSRNGKYLAYGLQTAGSDWQEWRVRDVATGEDTSDRLL